MSGIIIGFYLMLLALCNIPFMQNWGAKTASGFLAEKLQTKVEIERIKLGIFNRVIVDGVKLYDKQDTLMLDIARLAAKVEILPLLKHKIRIDNAQLFGAKATLYKPSEDEAANFQFVLDAFKSQDTTSNPIDLAVGRLLVRRANVSYDHTYIPSTPGKFNPHHLSIKDLGFNATVRCLKPDSINAELRRFSLDEGSGFSLSHLGFKVTAGPTHAELTDFSLGLLDTELSLPSITAQYASLPQKGNFKDWAKTVNYAGEINLEVSPKDISAFVPKLKHWDSKITLKTDVQAENGIAKFNDIKIKDLFQHISLVADAEVDYSNDIATKANIKSLVCDAQAQQFLTQNLQGQAREISPHLSRLEHLEAYGNVLYAAQTLTTDLHLSTALGDAHIEGKLTKGNEVDATVKAERIELGKLLAGNAEKSLQTLTMTANAKGKIKAEDKRPDLHVNGNIEELIFKDYAYRNLSFSGHCSGREYGIQLNHDDANAALALQSVIHLGENSKHLYCSIRANDINPHAMNLTKGFKGERFDADIEAELSGTNIDNLQGDLSINGLKAVSDSLGTCDAGNILVSFSPQENGKAVRIESQALNATVKGQFKWKNLGTVFQQIASNYLPKIFRSPDKVFSDNVAFNLEMQDTTLVQRLTGQTFSIPEKAIISGRMNGKYNLLQMSADIPQLVYGGETLKKINLQMQSSSEMLQTSLNLQRMMKNNPIDLGIDAYTGYDKIRATLNWDNGLQPKQSGLIDATGIFFNGRDGKLALHTKLASSDIVVSDTTWTLHPSTVEYHDGVVDVIGFRLSQADRYLNINGRASREENDSLIVELNKINLEYIFQMINFNAVEFAGNATGHVYAKQVMKKPIADAYLTVGDFTFNKGKMGSLDVHGNWGDYGNSIYLNARIQDPEAQHNTTVRGTITPGRGPRGGLDLSVNTKRINLYFMNKFTDGIFENLQGRASGWARIFGPFKKINIEGDILANEVSMGVKMLGTTYRVYNDSIILRPDNIWIRNATAYDYLGQPGNSEHRAVVDGHLMHNNLKNLRYNFNIKAENILGYNFTEFGEESFYGTVYASGDVRLSGRPGYLQVDINATPQAGTQFVYNVNTPETLTEASFISYVSPKDSLAQSSAEKTSPDKNKTDEEEEDDEENDIRLNFNLDITPDAGMRLLMDPKSGDYINLNGNGRIKADYYNKGKFRMYGIYHVDHGIYKLSLQDFIRKDFTFKRGGTITFGGDAYQAALNLQAVYTVPNVSLDDLSATSLGLSNTRVDCVMSITGRPEAPVVSFDFDLPNANEDEKQMVRSMVSTEEEKNMQAIYLLGIGRFYNYNAQYMQGNSSQSSTAMNSLISSTLSSQFNQMMSNMVGNSNWSFGANLRTGETGWEELDVEGMLSGRFLNNRLLFNGNFGYRESVYSNNNFIGDFDVQYLLTPTGTISLKAYNETNDRYFIQSSLTTQGIGIQFKKDFNHWKDLFRKRKSKKTTEKKGKQK